MTSPNRTRVDALPQIGEIGSRQQRETEVQATPAHARGAHLDTGTDQLVRGLASLEPGLNAFITLKNEEAKVAGAKVRAMQQGDQVQIPEGSAQFQQGYMEMHGQVAGMGAARKMREAYESGKNTPGFNPEEALQKIVTDETKGLTDKDALKGFLPALVRERESIRNEWSKHQLDQLRSDNDVQLMARARDVAERPYSGEELVGTTPSQLRHAEYQQFIERGLALGKTRPELALAFTHALVNRAVETQDPSVLDVAAIRDKSGIALIDNPAQGRAILEAKHKAQELQKKSIYDSGTEYRTNTLLDLEETLHTSPNDPRLDLDSLKQHAHTYGLFNDHDGKELAAFWRRVVDAREKGVAMDKLRDDLFGPNARIAAARPESQPLIDAEYNRIWEAWQQSQANGNDPRATQGFIMLNLSRHQQWGVPDRRLKAMLSNINTEPDKDGKPSPDFVRAYSVYSAIQDSPNKDLLTDLTDERSRTLLHHFRGMIVDEKRSSAEAFALAKDFTTPAVQERLKAINVEKVRTEFDTELRSRLKKGDWYTFGLTGKASNDGQFLTTLNDVFHRKLALLGNVDAAKKQTLEMIPQYLARDSNDSWTPRPDDNVLAANGGSQRAFEVGLKAYTTDLGGTLKTEAKALGRDAPAFSLDRVGQGDAYIVRVNGVPSGRVELSEILQRGAATYVTSEQAQTLTGLAKRIRMNDGRQMSDEEVDANWGNIYQLYGLGRINSNQLDKLQGAVRTS
jgi:hypothetical protein